MLKFLVRNIKLIEQVKKTAELSILNSLQVNYWQILSYSRKSKEIVIGVVRHSF